MALTRDLTSTFGTARAAKGIYGRNLVSFEIDFSATDMSLAQNEVMGIVDIPAGCIIYGGFMKVETAEAEITDIDIGVSTGAATDATLADGISMASTGYVAFNNVTSGGVYTTAASELVLTNKDAQTLNSAKIEIILDIASFSTALTS